MKCIDQFGWERFEKLRRDLKFSLRQAYWTLGLALLRKRTNFCNRNVPLTQQNCFSARELLEIA